MNKIVISASVQRFLRQDIGSPECLDILLLMRRHVERWWMAQQLADELGLPAEIAQTQLERLSARNLLDVRVSESLLYRYNPGADSLAKLVDHVSRAHCTNRGAIHEIVSGTRQGASLFAEAFRIRKDNSDG